MAENEARHAAAVAGKRKRRLEEDDDIDDVDAEIENDEGDDKANARKTTKGKEKQTEKRNVRVEDAEEKKQAADLQMILALLDAGISPGSIRKRGRPKKAKTLSRKRTPSDDNKIAKTSETQAVTTLLKSEKNIKSSTATQAVADAAVTKADATEEAVAAADARGEEGETESTRSHGVT